LSVIEMDAVRVPDALGLNVTLKVHLAPMPNDDPQVEVIAKLDALVPVREVLLIVIAALPVLVSVTVLALLVVFISCVPNATLVGVRLATGLTAVPVRDIC